MDKMELYWWIVNQTIMIINLFVEGWLFYKFVKPFINRKAYFVGLSYLLTMLVFAFVPIEIPYAKLQAIFVAWIVMCLIERRNIKQKIFLATSMYLFHWIVYGVSLIFRNIIFAVWINQPYMLMQPIKQLVAYIIAELAYYGVSITVMYLVIKLIHKVYENKKEEMSGKELLLFFTPLLTIMTGHFAFSFFSKVYLADMGIYVQNKHLGYSYLLILYQIASFVALIISIVMYQKLKKSQCEEKVNILLSEQLENTKNYISEVEKLYGDIRSLKHDIGNHITVLENLFLKNEKEELERYLTELKLSWNNRMSEVKTGNPVTDVIIMQKQKEAEEKGIEFKCNFVYPVNTNINAFDISVILNNALTNAFEGVKGCTNPYVFISAYRKKNAYMLEVTNCIKKRVEIDEETGLPETTKKDKSNHGFGILNIRKVAEQYFGGIDISQDESSFTLTIMLMVQ